MNISRILGSILSPRLSIHPDDPPQASWSYYCAGCTGLTQTRPLNLWRDPHRLIFSWIFPYSPASWFADDFFHQLLKSRTSAQDFGCQKSGKYMTSNPWLKFRLASKKFSRRSDQWMTNTGALSCSTPLLIGQKGRRHCTKPQLIQPSLDSTRLAALFEDFIDLRRDAVPWDWVGGLKTLPTSHSFSLLWAKISLTCSDQWELVWHERGCKKFALPASRGRFAVRCVSCWQPFLESIKCKWSSFDGWKVGSSHVLFG